MGKIEKEKKIINLMINLYCKNKHGSNNKLCEECRELLEYADMRLNNCKFGENKSTCSRCPIRCYKKDMKIKVKEVMKFSGPRLIIYSPVALFKHMLNL